MISCTARGLKVNLYSEWQRNERSLVNLMFGDLLQNSVHVLPFKGDVSIQFTSVDGLLSARLTSFMCCSLQPNLLAVI